MSRDPDDILAGDARALSRRIHDRAVSCREVMAATLARIDRFNPAVTALVSLRDREDLLREADAKDALLDRGLSQGPLHGFPQAPKDLAATRGIATTRGSPLFRHQIPKQDAIFVERLRAGGAIFVGKTNTPEFGLGSQTYNPVFGATGNAYDPRLTAGGSSGGAACALALGMLAVADGSDMMGSLRNPAAFNNVFGFRPSAGRVPHGVVPDLFFQQLGYDGPMGRSVADLALLLSVMAGFDARAPQSLAGDPAVFAQPLEGSVAGVRVGWLGDLGGHLAFEPGILELCQGALATLGDLGCVVDEATAGFPLDALWTAWTDLRSFLVAGDLGALYADPVKRAQMKPEAIFEIERGLALSGAEVFAASARRSAWYRRMLVLFERFDVLALPSAQVFPFDHATPWPRAIDGRAMDSYHRWMEVVVPASMAGVPVISVPAGFNAAGLPMGLQVIGKPRDDLSLLRLAHAYDLATRWPARRPPPVLSPAS
ncbi:amidase [Rhodospirillum rubrum]|uniref:amidase n=1 Tax=Rhodospirillum rubrum TaxID=1085 RepID=UPI0019089297|nr:amidase [Rhodospirillum rubrum]MBK1663939.1 amidase [Rhodospirillum rubrum]MBK1676611.1 amidase [Rhodospirillum rubrum]